VSIIMVDGSFRERFHALDYFADQSLPAERYEQVWVEYYHRVQSLVAERAKRVRNLRTIALGRTGTYHSSYCFNEGIRAARGELLVIPDADVAVDRDFLKTVCAEHQMNEKLVMYVHRYDEPRDAHKEPIDLDDLRKTCVLTNPVNYGGCLTVRKKWLLEINGYEQHPTFGTGYHANGLDVYTRLKNYGLHVMWHPQLKLYHAWHPYPPGRGGQEALQLVVINHRACEKSTLAFDGLDGTRNAAMPDRVSRDVASARRSPGVGMRGFLTTIRNCFRK